ncbi:MAG: hypothetical protein WA705_12780 [Candidatus Ozemobacteraceae bacterium]
MTSLLLSPPLAFLFILMVVMLTYRLSVFLVFHAPDAAGKLKAYACGEDSPIQRVRPDYTNFFQFAFFFTLLHVVAMILATMPSETFGSVFLAVLYIVGSLIGMSMLFRR